MQHRLQPDVNHMLLPEVLSGLTNQDIFAVQRRPLESLYNKSGSRLLAIETNNGKGPRFILKRVSLDWDWQMRATNDTGCRAVALWQYGILDRLPPEIEPAIIACARDGTGWAILMQDVSRSMLPYAPIRKHQNQIFLDAMAALHATFMEDPRIRAPDLGLCTLCHTYSVFSPATGQRELSRTDEVPKRILEGWELVASELPTDVVDIVMPLVSDPAPLCDALARYPDTLVHGDWRHANQGLIHSGKMQQVILLDWQLATIAAPAVEIARYLGTNSALFPVSKEACIAYYKKRLAHRLADRFSESWWRPQLELSLLGGFVQDGWAIMLKATNYGTPTRSLASRPGMVDRTGADWSQMALGVIENSSSNRPYCRNTGCLSCTNRLA